MPGLDSPNPAGNGLDSPRLGEEGLELLGGPPTMLTMDTRHRRTINTEGRQSSSLLVGGRELQ